ncbi:MAG: T9SS type A sorting domain-containing protein [Chitinophagales bacterium]
MKKIFLLMTACVAMLSANAQLRNSALHLNRVSDNNVVNNYGQTFGTGARTTASTLYHYDEEMMNMLTTDSLWYYKANYGTGTDSGLLLGTSMWGLTEFAERYDFNAADSSVKVIGVVSIFHGVVNPASTHTVRFRMRNVAGISGTVPLQYSGFPSTLADSSALIPYSQLGVGPAATGDTFKAFWFADSGTVAYRTTSFFVGYATTYNWAAMAGDTICALVTSYNHNVEWTITTGPTDTVINDQAVLYYPAAGGWNDLRFDLGGKGDYFLYAIIDASYSSTLGVNGITNKKFTFYGNYPNPAVNSTNIRFSLAVSSDVTIRITDMSGRIINTINETNLSSGEHIIPIETSNMAAGNYLLTINAAAGGGIASKFTVTK